MKYVFLDLDNTLTDRRATVNAYAEEFKVRFQQQLKSNIDVDDLALLFNKYDRGGYETHESRSNSIAELDIWIEPADVQDLSSHWQDWVPNNSLPMYGLYECLDALTNVDIKLCLVTNGKSRNQRDKIKKLGLEKYFDEIVISEEVGFKKPAVEIFNIALAKMGCVSGDALFLGDHPFNDYLASKNLGFLAVWFSGPQEWPVDLPLPDYSIGSLLDLPVLVTTLINR